MGWLVRELCRTFLIIIGYEPPARLPNCKCIFCITYRWATYKGKKMYQPWLARTWLALAILNAVAFVSTAINLACDPDDIWTALPIAIVNGPCAVWCWRNYLRQNMRYYTNALDAIASLDDGGGQ